MPPKKSDKDKIIRAEQIVQTPMEDVMHSSMIPYSEYVILERALPRVEDGLKPVQRRILYTMHELGITPDKPHRKCARIVGDCLGKFHPHGDTSVYDALARMAQPFVMRGMLVDGHGNFGSIDGDSPAAMRYTEARMTELAMLLLKDIDKDTVGFHLNFDDTQKEPDLLPAHFPNLLVNGSSGIAVGLATNIPPHNLGEVIDATIAQIDNPNITTEELMKHIPAPDFPTGGILAADEELMSAYATGRGKLKVRAKVHVEDGISGRKLLVITEIPYQVNKAAMLEKILRLSEEKKALLSGIYDIRDESDRTGMRAVVELRRDVDPEKVLNVLYKYSDLQSTFGVNLMAIAGGKPVLLGLKGILEHYVKHQKTVISRRTRHELAQAEARAHVLEGLIIAVDNLDEVIRLIRASKNPKEARDRLCERFNLTQAQSQAILDMRLQRLTNLEILTLRREYADLEKLIAKLKAILKSEKKLMDVIKGELLDVRTKYADARRTEIVASYKQIVIEDEAPTADEVTISMTRKGFFRRAMRKAYEKAMAAGEITDPPRFALNVMSNTKLLMFTDMGNCYTVAAEQIPECRAKDRGLPTGGLLAGLENGEAVVAIHEAKESGEFLFVTRGGLVKRCEKADYNVRKSKVAAANLKGGDRVLTVLDPAGCDSLLMISKGGMSIHFAIGEISLLGRTAAGVKGMALAADDSVAFAFAHSSEGEIILASELGYIKRCLLIDYDRQARAGKGVKTFPLVKAGKGGTNGSRVAGAMLVKQPYDFLVHQLHGAATKFNTEDVPIESRSGKGVPFILVVMDDFVEEIMRV